MYVRFSYYRLYLSISLFLQFTLAGRLLEKNLDGLLLYIHIYQKLSVTLMMSSQQQSSLISDLPL